MSWSVGATGSPEHVRNAVNTAHIPATQRQGEACRQAIRGLLDTIPDGSNVSVSAYGHDDGRQGNASLTVAYTPADTTPAGVA